MASVGAVVGGLWGFTIALAVSGVGKMGIDLAQNAWIGHHVPFARRARATATVELSWALAFLAGVPMLALAVGRWGCRGAVPHRRAVPGRADRLARAGGSAAERRCASRITQRADRPPTTMRLGRPLPAGRSGSTASCSRSR